MSFIANPRHFFRGLVKQKCDLDDVAIADLEVGVYNWCITFSQANNIVRNWKNPRFLNIYRSKCISILANIDKESSIMNTKLIERLKEYEFLPHELAFMPRENMFPDRWKDAIDKKLKKNEHVYEEKPAAMTNQFKCGKCKKRECVFQEFQLRSCDEPMTLFITCLNCGNRWRIG